MFKVWIVNADGEAEFEISAESISIDGIDLTEQPKKVLIRLPEE